MEGIKIDLIDTKRMNDDIEMLCRLERKIFGADGYPRYFFRQSAELFHDTFLICRGPDKKIIGYLLGATKREEAWMLSMCVDEPRRGEGIGSALLKYFLQILKEKSAKNAFITVDPKNHGAINLYTKHGFRIQKMIEDYHGKGYHRYLLKKEI